MNISGLDEKGCGFQSQNFRKIKRHVTITGYLFIESLLQNISKQIIEFASGKKDHDDQIFGYKKPCYVNVRKKS